MYVIDPDSGTALDVGCVISIDGVNVTLEQNEVTCLRDLVRSYEAGLGTPGQMTFGIYFDPQDATHIRLHELKRAGEQLHWAIGLSDGTGILPGATALDSEGEYDYSALPTSRSWLTLVGYMSDYPFSFAQNSQITSNIVVQVSGEPIIIPAVS